MTTKQSSKKVTTSSRAYPSQIHHFRQKKGKYWFEWSFVSLLLEKIICQWSMGFLSPPDPLSHLTPDKSSHQYYRRNSLCHVNVAFWKMWSHCPLDPYNKIQLWNAMATCWPLTAPYRMTASNFCLMALNLSWSVLSTAECNNQAERTTTLGQSAEILTPINHMPP